MVFIRGIPDSLKAGVADGKYMVSGNLIKHTGGKKTIAGQLIPVGPEAARSVSGIAASLTAATTALAGANLLVSVAGFVVVQKQLDRLSDQLDGMQRDIRDLLVGQADMQSRLDALDRAKMLSGIRGVERALEYNDHSALLESMRVLDECRLYFESISIGLLHDAKKAYSKPDAVEWTVKSAVLSGVALAHAHALSGKTQRALDGLSEQKVWLSTINEEFRRPFSEEKYAPWIRSLQAEAVHGCERMIAWLADVIVGVVCLRNQYQLCADSGKKPQELLSELPSGGIYFAVNDAHVSEFEAASE
jgi:hypothetical protein